MSKMTEKTMEKALSRDDDILAMYLREISKIPLLKVEEEGDLIRRAKEGDNTTKEKILRSNLRFVVNVAKKYRNRGLPFVDLISEGNVGLIHAFERFDINRGFRFISYAVWWIRQAILKAVYEKSKMIRLPMNRFNELIHIEKARNTLEDSHSEMDEIQKIAASLNMDATHVSELISIGRDHVSSDTPVYHETDNAVISDFFEDTANTLPEEFAITNSLKKDIDKFLTILDERESEIIRLRFGLGGITPLSLKEIGRRFGLTKERIRQIEQKAIKRLQHPMRNGHLVAYMF